MSNVPEVDEVLVRALLREQHPDLADLEVAPLGGGWDNALFRLGDDLTVRLPRRVAAAHLIEHEQRWLPGLVADLPAPAEGGLATSAPLRPGRPGCGYPWSWNVGPWHPGEPLAVRPPADPVDAAARLGNFLAAFHRPAPPDAPPNPYRGVPLTERSERLALALGECATRGIDLGEEVTADRVEGAWADLVATPPWPGPPQWLHGDLHPLNLLVHRGRLTAVIDFGDLTAGDPATDLSAAWLVFDPDESAARRALREAAGTVDDDTWARGRAWALALSVSYLAGSPAGSPLLGVARRTLAGLLA